MDRRIKLSKAKTKTTIKVERKPEVEALLARAKAPKPAPTPAKTKAKRGRPKKVKPDPTLKKYKDHPLAVELDKMVCFALNTTFTKPPSEKMAVEDTNIGEALIYCAEYYGWVFFEHPILILVMAIGGTFWTAFQKRQVKTEVEKEIT